MVSQCFRRELTNTQANQEAGATHASQLRAFLTDAVIDEFEDFQVSLSALSI
jgi:hypothetical protein